MFYEKKTIIVSMKAMNNKKNVEHDFSKGSMIRNILYFFRRKGYNLKYILLVGYSSAAEEYITRIIANPQWGYVIRGILDDTKRNRV